MRRYERIILAFLLCYVILMTACSSQSSSAQNSMDYKALLKILQAQDTITVPVGTTSPPFMEVQGHIVKIQGEQVEIYEYATVSDVDKKASTISPDGSTFTTKSPTGTSASVMDWVMPPHFYKQGRVIVMYFGSNSSIMETLTKVLGKQFAGASYTVGLN